MKYIFSILILSITTLCLHAQTKIRPTKFEVVVAFASMGTGTSSDSFLKIFVKKFNKKNKVNIPAYKVSGCGREGEYNILFSLAKLKRSLTTKFTRELKSEIEKQVLKNKSNDQNSGDISLGYNKQLSDFGNCREEAVIW